MCQKFYMKIEWLDCGTLGSRDRTQQYWIQIRGHAPFSWENFQNFGGKNPCSQFTSFLANCAPASKHLVYVNQVETFNIPWFHSPYFCNFEPCNCSNTLGFMLGLFSESKNINIGIIGKMKTIAKKIRIWILRQKSPVKLFLMA